MARLLPLCYKIKKYFKVSLATPSEGGVKMGESSYSGDILSLVAEEAEKTLATDTATVDNTQFVDDMQDVDDAQVVDDTPVVDDTQVDV